MDDLSRLERNLVEQVAQWDRFHAWAHGICVVTFDLELGQERQQFNGAILAFSVPFSVPFRNCSLK